MGWQAKEVAHAIMMTMVMMMVIMLFLCVVATTLVDTTARLLKLLSAMGASVAMSTCVLGCAYILFQNTCVYVSVCVCVPLLVCACVGASAFKGVGCCCACHRTCAHANAYAGSTCVFVFICPMSFVLSLCSLPRCTVVSWPPCLPLPPSPLPACAFPPSIPLSTRVVLPHRHLCNDKEPQTQTYHTGTDIGSAATRARVQ